MGTRNFFAKSKNFAKRFKVFEWAKVKVSTREGVKNSGTLPPLKGQCHEICDHFFALKIRPRPHMNRKKTVSRTFSFIRSQRSKIRRPRSQPEFFFRYGGFQIFKICEKPRDTVPLSKHFVHLLAVLKKFVFL